MIEFSSTGGDFSKTISFFKRIIENTKKLDYLNEYGKRGVELLSAYTPKRTGKTAASWIYEITKEDNSQVTITWKNTNIQDGVNVAILIQYGHGTGWGAYVQGIDYINPALQPLFDEMAQTIWKETIS